MAAGMLARLLFLFGGPTRVVTVLRNLLLAIFGRQFFICMEHMRH